MKYSVRMLVCWLTLLKCTQADLNIAIIGGGVGGTSCAYFLREIFQDSVNIDIYEGGKIGGRLATVVMDDGNEYESGGSVIHERNKYMSDFLRKFGLQKRTKIFNSKKVGFYNGNDFSYIQNDYYSLNIISILWRYGYSVYQLKNFVNNILNKFDRIYQLQSFGLSFDSIYDLLATMDPSFVKYLNVSVRDAYLNHEHFSKTMVNEIVYGSLRNNYGQNINVHEFAGSIAMVGMDTSVWSVKGGNKRVAEKLLNASRVTLIDEHVIQIIKNSESYTLLTKTKKSTNYNYVVIATPIALNQNVPITFYGMSLTLNIIGKYHRTVTTLVVGKLRRTKFSSIYDDNSPILIISINETDFFNSISNVEGVNDTGSLNVWKVFSEQPLSNYQIDELFESTSDVKIIDWMAYPQYKVPTKPQRFQIENRLYHINAIEWVASTMEMSCISAKNIALLIMQHNKQQNGTT